MPLIHDAKIIIVDSGRKIRPDVLIDWAIQIARGMAYLHDGAPISLGKFLTIHASVTRNTGTWQQKANNIQVPHPRPS